MTDDQDLDKKALRRGLRAVLNSRGSGSNHQLARASAARTLARLDGQQPAAPAARKPKDREDELWMVVEKHVPDVRKLVAAESDPDCMRDLDAALQGWNGDPVIWSWCPCCPENIAEAERDILDAAGRLGVESGPFPLPGEGPLTPS
jgi:hypothetical protein